MSRKPSIALDARALDRTLRRMADQIVELNAGTDNLVLVGIQRRGVQLAERIVRIIKAQEGVDIVSGALDITLYRDDLRLRPTRALEETSIPDVGIDGKIVVLVDDVLFSGRTIRAALDALNDVGRPAAVRLAVLVDRGHRELPIRPDYVGKNIPTSPAEKVRVRLSEIDDSDSVEISAGEDE